MHLHLVPVVEKSIPTVSLFFGELDSLIKLVMYDRSGWMRRGNTKQEVKLQLKSKYME